MIKKIDDKQVLSLDEAGSEYRGCTYLMILTSDEADPLTQGRVCAVSDQTNISDLLKMEEDLISKGERVLLGIGDAAEHSFEDLEIVSGSVY